MTVAELIAKLAEFSPDMQVMLEIETRNDDGDDEFLMTEVDTVSTWKGAVVLS